MTLYISGENLQLYDKLLKEYILTRSEELLDLLSYGVRWEKGVADPHLTRIGNLNWHRSLPLLSQMRGCIVQSPSKGVHVVKYWLHPDDWRFRKDNAGYVFANQQMTFVEKISGDLYKYTYVNSLFDTLRFKHLYLKVRDEFVFKITDIDTATNTATVTGEIKFADTSTYLIEVGSCTNGYDGEVMVYMPGGYLHSVDDPEYSEVRISPFNIGGDWEYHKPGYISAYRITVLNEVPTDMGYLSTLPVNSAISVANVETYCRGGGNRSSYDLYLETDPFRSDLGKPISNLTRSTARTYARNCNNELLSYFLYKWLYWLYTIEYANFNSQEEINHNPNFEGFKQGGLGNGVTSIKYTSWTYYNNNAPLIFCGYLNNIGNITNTSAVLFKLPEKLDGDPVLSIIQYPLKYRGIEIPFGDTDTILDGILLKLQDSTSQYNVYTTNILEDYNDNNILLMLLSGILTNLNGYTKEYDLGKYANITSRSIGGSATTYKCDFNYGSSTSPLLRMVAVGGLALGGSECGFAYISYGLRADITTNIFYNYRSFKEISE